jgi:hypothetical protein
MANFPEFMLALRDGGVSVDAGAALDELMEAVIATGRAGTITMTVKVVPASKGNGVAFAFEDNITIKAPKAEKGSTLLFRRRDGTLSRRDERQPELPMRAVKADPVTGEIEEASNG